MNYFTFDGIDSRDYNTYIATSNAFDAPGREDEVIKVPGSNNIYYLTEGTYKPFDIKLYCYIPSNMQVKTDDLRNFLLTKGTCRYTEAIRPNEFRVARFIEAYELDVSDRVSAAFVLTFKAQPQRYLTTNTPITTTATADTTTDTTMSLTTVPTPINISLNGNTTQEGSSGKNLLPIEAHVGLPYNPSAGTAISPTAKPTQWTNNGDGTFKMTLTSWEQASLVTAPLPAGQYVARVTTVTAGMRVGIYVVNADNTANRVSAVKNGTTANEAFQVATTLTAGQYFAFYIAGGSGECTIKEPMVEAGSTATAYEPHISPTNPQTIHNVSGDNTINVTGKNLQPNECTPSTYIGITTENSGDMIHYFGTASGSGGRTAHKMKHVVLSRGAYSFSAHNISTNGTTNLPDVVVQKVEGTTYTTIISRGMTTGGSFSLTEETEISIGFNCSSGTTYNCYFNIQLEQGTKQTTYEPYTRQSYSLNLPVENLIPNGTTTTSNGITFTVNADGSVLVNGVATNTAWFVVNIPSEKFIVGEYYTFGSMPNGVDTNTVNGFIGGITSSNQWGQETPKTIQATTINSPQFVIRVTSGTAVNNMLFYPQLEKGSKANHYTPYGTSPIELNKIGTYQDYIYKNGGKWYVHKETGKVDLGTLTWSYYSTSPTFMYNATLPVVSGTSSALCDAYPCGLSTDNKTFRFNGQILRIYDPDYSDASAFKTAMNGVMLYYPLATPTNTEITDTTLINQLNNIEKAYSYNGTTNILQVSNDNGFMLEVVSLHSNNVSSSYKGEPIITVNSTGLIYFNGCVIKVNQAPMTINSQTMQAYNGVVNLNNYIEANDFPMIEAGTNVIGSEMPLSIVPNYWKL